MWSVRRMPAGRLAGARAMAGARPKRSASIADLNAYVNSIGASRGVRSGNAARVAGISKPLAQGLSAHGRRIANAGHDRSARAQPFSPVRSIGRDSTATSGPVAHGTPWFRRVRYVTAPLRSAFVPVRVVTGRTHQDSPCSILVVDDGAPLKLLLAGMFAE